MQNDAEPKNMAYERLFMTGATGVLGGHLLKQLLLETSAHLYCLVRADNEIEGAARLQKFLAAYDPNGELSDAFKLRVHPVLGDITKDKFGLSEGDYLNLTDLVDSTIHVAAFTNLFSNYRRIEPINVGGTKRVIDFVLRTKQKYLCHVSTHTVVGSKAFDKNCAFKESDFDIGQTFTDMTYQHTKFLAEKLVRDATSEGLIWNIIRPGQIFGEADTGHYPQGQSNVSGLFYDIFKTVIETGVAFKSQSHFDIVPVDYVSKGTVFLALKRNRFFETYHITNPDVKCYTDVIHILQKVGYKIKFVDQNEYRDLLKERKLIVNGQEYKSPTTSAFKWWFKREGFDYAESGFTDCTYTRDILSNVGIECAPIAYPLLKTYVDAGIKTGYFPPLPRPEHMVEHRMEETQEFSQIGQ